MNSDLKSSSGKLADFEYLKNSLESYHDDIRVLDIGVGKDPFRSLKNRFKKLTNLDLKPYETVNVVHDFNKGLPFEDNSFDCVILTNTLEHCPNPDFILSEISRVLKRGGALIGTVPFLIQIHQEPYDFYRFTRFALEKLLVENNYGKVSVQELGSPFNVYQNFQGFFFWHLLNTRLNAVLKFFIKIIWFGQRLLLKIASPIYKQCRQDKLMVQGYGFQAFKH